jgi:asparagine synthase (glutamine-hydrolysing)
MCGINGIYNLKKQGRFADQVLHMNQAMAHRGPDDEGCFNSEGISLGHRRLSIIDLSPAGHQPMHFGQGRYTIVYNGELYNYQELRSELTDVAFQTTGDTEVILAAYAQWGTNCLQRFNGMFAFAIYDQQEHSIFIARDRLGIKPAYYSWVDDAFVFASEIRTILASGLVKKELQTDKLKEYAIYQTIHAPATILKNVSLLPAGHFMLHKLNEKGEIQCWWKPEPSKQLAEVNYKETCRKVRQLLRDAVERRLVADVPFGAFLSGGIDSSAIVGLMTEVAKSKVKTFSVVFDDSEFSEAQYARLIAKKFHTDHHEIRLRPDDFLHELPFALDAMDHPGGDGPNTFVVSKATKAAGITMALSGLGGDELFAGYDLFKRAYSLEKKKWLNATPRPIRAVAGSVMRRLVPGIATEKMADFLTEKLTNFEHFYPYARLTLAPEWVNTAGKKVDKGSDFLLEILQSEKVRGYDSEHILSRVSVAEMYSYMQHVLLRDTDQMSMAHGLELRVPFLDYKLVEYVLRLPDATKYPFTPKKLLVDSLGDLLPREIIDRPKMGFTFPWKNWMKNELHAFCDQRITYLILRPEFQDFKLKQIWLAFNNNDPRVTWSRIWHLVSLSYWLEKNGL